MDILYGHLVGKTYEEYNCWEVVKEFYKICFNAELKQYYEEVPENRNVRADIICANMGEVERVNTPPEFGDIIIVEVLGIPSHIGVYIGSGRMLHSTRSKGCVIEKVSRHAKVIEGFYRFKK
jgi:hypothetical protein